MPEQLLLNVAPLYGVRPMDRSDRLEWVPCTASRGDLELALIVMETKIQLRGHGFALLTPELQLHVSFSYTDYGISIINGKGKLLGFSLRGNTVYAMVENCRDMNPDDTTLPNIAPYVDWSRITFANGSQPMLIEILGRLFDALSEDFVSSLILS